MAYGFEFSRSLGQAGLTEIPRLEPEGEAGQLNSLAVSATAFTLFHGRAGCAIRGAGFGALRSVAVSAALTTFVGLGRGPLRSAAVSAPLMMRVLGVGADSSMGACPPGQNNCTLHRHAASWTSWSLLAAC